MGRVTVLALAIACGAGGVASAEEPKRIDKPEWVRLPSSGDMERFYPPGAMSASMPGRAVIECTVVADGTLRSCKTVEETPLGFGFGRATVRVSEKFRMKPVADGESVDGGVIRVTLRWTIAASEPDPYYRVARWTEAPTRDEVEAARPAGATGTAYLDCRLASSDLRLTSCRVLEETVEDVGLGAAAQALISRFKAAEPLPARAGRLVLPFRFGDDRSDALGPAHVFAAAPSPEALASAFPVAARRAGVDQGLTQLDCRIEVGGVPTACRVFTETPEGLGFGAAALGLVGEIRLAPWTTDGRAVIGTDLRLPIRFMDDKPAG